MCGIKGTGTICRHFGHFNPATLKEAALGREAVDWFPGRPGRKQVWCDYFLPEPLYGRISDLNKLRLSCQPNSLVILSRKKVAETAAPP